MRRLLPLSFLVLTACSEPPTPQTCPTLPKEDVEDTSGETYLTNDQIIAETKKCEEAGMEAVPLSYVRKNGGRSRTSDIQCEPISQGE